MSEENQEEVEEETPNRPGVLGEKNAKDRPSTQGEYIYDNSPHREGK